MIECQYNTFGKLFNDIKSDLPVVSLDDPKRLLIGWYSPSTDKYHHIRLSSLKSRFAFIGLADPLSALLYDLIINAEGRSKIADMINAASFDRWLKLKAFW